MNETSLNFSGAFWSLLHYYKAGSRETFSRSIVSKSLEFARIELENEQQKKVRSYLFKRLQDFALIDVKKDGSSTWSSLRNGLIPLKDDKVLVYGDKRYQDKVCALDASGNESLHTLYEIPVFGEIDLCLTLPLITKPEDSLSSREHLFSDWGLNVGKVLPSAEKVAADVLNPIDSASRVRFLENLQYWDVKYLRWNAIDAKHLNKHFFRCLLDPDMSTLYQYFVMLKEDTETKLYEIDRRANDWRLFSAYSLLGEILIWEYSRLKRCLSVPQEHLVQMPDLIRRYLCTASMAWPARGARSYQFLNIDRIMCAALENKYRQLRIIHVD
mgnify:CR=1 FL=1